MQATLYTRRRLHHTATAVATAVISTVLPYFIYATGFPFGTKGNKTIKLDNRYGNNQVQFHSKAPLEEINGTASVTGSFSFDPSNIEATHGKIVVPVNSMQTGIELRNKHLMSKDWLDEESYKEIVFDVKSISSVQIVSSAQGKGVAKGIAEGVLFLHGVSKQISCPIELTYIEKGDVVMVKTEMSVSLRDFNISGKRGIVGSKVAETIAVKATMFGAGS
ncbi:MAG: YceI family protein [Bacteroidota bacterium]|nr:YceI family protein [Candidatus Kapabacteria bacterium]MDW8218953.1 YceI family protein [Bacteroidota bacterium]